MSSLTGPRRGQVFRYDGYSIDPANNRVTCRYSLDGRSFTEVIGFPSGGDWTQPAVVEGARLLYLLTGVSYYKTGATPAIDLGETATTAAERAFLREFYVDGLGEFAYRAQPRLDLSDLRITGPDLDRSGPTGYTPTSTLRPLVPFGGGVDSLTSVELLRPLTGDASLFVVNRPGDRFQAIEDAAVGTGLPIVRAERLIDPILLDPPPGEFFNGHVPVTGIISAIAVLAALLGGHDSVVMSNELSASVGTVELEGRAVNHQYSKGESFESGFRAMLTEAIGGEFEYFSLLRPYSGVWIARRFAEAAPYLSSFRSCNRAFHIDPAKRLDHWCGRCDKCCFVDLILAPFLSAERLRAVFTHTPEPLDQPDLLPKFRTLLGLSADTKPWECVGDVDECRTSAALAAARPDRAGSPVLVALTAEFDAAAAALDAAEMLKPVGQHNIPDRYAPADLLV